MHRDVLDGYDSNEHPLAAFIRWEIFLKLSAARRAPVFNLCENLA
jgi:hypothetical protein